MTVNKNNKVFLNITNIKKTITKLEKVWKNWNPQTLLERLENGTATLKSNVAVSLKAKHSSTWPGDSTPRYPPKRAENIHPHKNLYTKVHSSIIRNSKKTGNNPGVNRLRNGIPYHEILFDNKKK